MQTIEILDSHTGGEPTRLVINGFPELGQKTPAEIRDLLAKQYDHYRQAVILEPRGSDVMVGALLLPAINPKATAGVVFFNNTGYLGMCGHGTIGLFASLAYLGRIQTGTHLIETPVGLVQASLHTDNRVSVRNVPSYRYKKAVTINVPDCGTVTGDIAWGGNWFFLVDAPDKVYANANRNELTEYTSKICNALYDQGIRGKDGGIIDHIELFGPDKQADSRNFVLCPGKAYDRSPCGTGTSAKLACLAADGKLKPNETWRQASIIGSIFEASYELGENDTIIPTISGYAHISAQSSLILQEDDPFQWGISC